MQLSSVMDVVAALQRTSTSNAHPLRDAGVAAALEQVIPATLVSFNNLRPAQRTDDEFELIRQDDIPEWPFDAFWDHFWSSAICSYTECEPQLRASSMTTSDFYSDRQWRSTGMYSEVLHPAGLEYELVVPMPAEAGVARRMLFARTDRRPFTSDECQIAQLLRPHIIEAIRYYERRQALSALTHRQRTIVMLLALGFDNTTIARRLGVSAGTVRVHLENIFERLDVNSRSEAVAKAHPDLVWC